MARRWSHSRLMKLLRCGEAFRREEIEREIPPPSSAMLRGTVVHQVAALCHGRQIEAKALRPTDPIGLTLSAALPSGEEVRDEAASRFAHLVKQSGVSRPPGGPQEIGLDKDRAIRGSLYYHGAVAPYVNPIAVEKKMVIALPDLDTQVSGIIDLETQHGATREIRDIKSGTRAPRPDAALSSDQLTMYALLDQVHSGSLAENFVLDHVITPLGCAAPYHVVQVTQRTPADIAVVLRRLKNALDATEAGAFLANGVGTWMCSPKWCQFWPDCPYVRR